MKYAAKGSKKGFGLGKALALVLSAAVVAGGVVGWNAHTAKEARLQAEAEAAAKAEAIAAAAAAYSQERSAFSDLVVEGMAVESMNASELSVTFHDQWEERKEASSANTGGGWVSPATGVFNASAYGYSEIGRASCRERV